MDYETIVATLIALRKTMMQLPNSARPAPKLHRVHRLFEVEEIDWISKLNCLPGVDTDFYWIMMGEIGFRFRKFSVARKIRWIYLPFLILLYECLCIYVFIDKLLTRTLYSLKHGRQQEYSSSKSNVPMLGEQQEASSILTSNVEKVTEARVGLVEVSCCTFVPSRVLSTYCCEVE